MSNDIVLAFDPIGLPVLEAFEEWYEEFTDTLNNIPGRVTPEHLDFKIAQLVQREFGGSHFENRRFPKFFDEPQLGIDAIIVDDKINQAHLDRIEKNKQKIKELKDRFVHERKARK